MRNRVHSVFVVLTLLLSTLVWGGCTDSSQPSDEDIFRAIDDSGIMKEAAGRFTVIPPAVIVQRSPQNKDGSWPVKVKFTLVYKMSDGRTSSPTETTTSFKIARGKNNAGKSTWIARLGS